MAKRDSQSSPKKTGASNSATNETTTAAKCLTAPPVSSKSKAPAKRKVATAVAQKSSERKNNATSTNSQNTKTSTPTTRRKKAPTSVKTARSKSRSLSLDPQSCAVPSTFEQIQLQAYLIYEQRQREGREGNPHSDWLEAERQLQNKKILQA